MDDISGKKNQPFYLTTTLPYVNADPHIGFALEIVHADIIARYKKLQGYDVFFNTGTDEHGIKILRKAEELNKDPQEYVDEYAVKFKGLKEKLGLLDDIHFIRTTDQNHKSAAQEFWRLCDKNGFIYKKNYKIKYCVGCELEKTDSELVNGRCPIHPHLELEIIDEENYFFKFSAFKEKLEQLYVERPDFVLPSSRFNEIKAFVSRGLEDFSISRLKSKMSWGVEVPSDPLHVMYVWFDALVNYISTIGWPKDMGKFDHYWPVVQFAGKDNLRQQSAMWQAMLMAAHLLPSYQIVIHGFITSGGQKMSKSLGNTINPYDIVAEYDIDALRYYIAREISPFEDSDFTMERFKTTYNAALANGLGNLVSRIMKMAETNLDSAIEISENTLPENFQNHLDVYEISKAADIIWKEIADMDLTIQQTQPFKLVKEDKEKGNKIISELVTRLHAVALMLNPILPETSEKIKMLIQTNKAPEKPLFMRKD
jgi:methionyl-tRNA synthetase